MNRVNDTEEHTTGTIKDCKYPICSNDTTPIM